MKEEKPIGTKFSHQSSHLAKEVIIVSMCKSLGNMHVIIIYAVEFRTCENINLSVIYTRFF